jgi:hypothetical protein
VSRRKMMTHIKELYNPVPLAEYNVNLDDKSANALRSVIYTAQTCNWRIFLFLSTS